MPPEKNEHDTVHELILENQRLLTENNQLLKKLKRDSIWAFWFRIAGFLILLGVPVFVYYYVIEPYFTSVGEAFETFGETFQDVPGWEQLKETVNRNKE